MPRFEVVNKGAFATLRIDLKKGETVKAERDALITRTGNVIVEGKLDGGFLKSLLRSVFSGESIFFQTLTADPRNAGDDESVLVGSDLLGEVMLLDLPMSGNRSYYLKQGAFLASETTVSLATFLQRDILKGALSGTGFFYLKAEGSGTLAVTSYGAIHKYSLKPNEIRYVDNNHLVAWDGHLNYTVEMGARTLLGSVTSGEGIALRFIGPGDVYVQSHTDPSESESSSSSSGNNALFSFNVGSRRRVANNWTSCQTCCVILFLIVFVAIAVFAIIFGESETTVYMGGQRGSTR